MKVAQLRFRIKFKAVPSDGQSYKYSTILNTQMVVVSVLAFDSNNRGLNPTEANSLLI